MSTEPLPELSGPSVLPAAGGKPRQLVVLLHGLGSDGNDLISLAPYWRPLLPHARFVSPHAPFAFDMAPSGRQWFSLQDWTPKGMEQGARIAAPILEAFVNKEMQRDGLRARDVALVGFSQGTMMALFCAPRWAHAVAGVVGFSGAVLGAEHLAREARSQPPVILIHGDQDDIVPISSMDTAMTALGDAGFSVRALRRPGLAHGIDAEGIRLAGEFLVRAFGASLKP
jgi:phospholipase/carboxylesterase